MEIFGFLFYFVLSTQKLPDLLCLEWETFLFLHHLIYKDKRHLAETFHMTSFRIGRTLSFYWGKIMLAQRENNGWERFGMCEDLSRSYIEPTGKRPLQRGVSVIRPNGGTGEFRDRRGKEICPIMAALIAKTGFDLCMFLYVSTLSFPFLLICAPTGRCFGTGFIYIWFDGIFFI